MRRYGRSYHAGLLGTLLLRSAVGPPTAAAVDPSLQLVVGLTEAGDATDQWLAMLRKRLPAARYQAIVGLRKRFTGGERAWAELIRSRVAIWEGEIPALVKLFDPIHPPERALIVIGNRGGEDAFTHDPTTIGFDLAALELVYGNAGLRENAERVDRLFRHEYVHLLQKAWLLARPYPEDSPLRAAVAEIWAEGLGVHYSMSDRWRSAGGGHSEAAARALTRLEPRFVARLAALACATPEQAEQLTAELSYAPFEQKWGALPAALWLEAEVGRSTEALRDFVVSGPDAVWAIAERQLPSALQHVLEEARLADQLCSSQRGRQTRQ